MEYYLTELKYTFDFLQTGSENSLQQLVKASSKENAQKVVEEKQKKSTQV